MYQLPTHRHLPPEAANLNFRGLVDGMPTPYMVMNRDLVIVYANAAYLRQTDRTLDDLAGRYMFDAFPDTKERVDQVINKFTDALTGVTTTMDKQEYQHIAADGTVSTKVWQCVQMPFYGPDGDVQYIVQHAKDITEEAELQRRNELIAQELEHRVKNIFAVVQAVAMLSGDRATSIDEFRDDFAGRIAAMTRTHDQLRANRWDGLGLKAIVTAGLEQFCGTASGRVHLTGPEVRLSPRGAQHASLLVHELATNAMKYGFLSVEGGELHITIEPGDDPHTLKVEWKESGLSGLEPPEREGFGSQLVNFMPNIRIDRVYEKDGLRLKIAARLLHPMEEGDTLI